jgi:CRISPR-associated endonuclease Csn1
MKILALDLGVTSCGYAVMKESGTHRYALIDYGVVMRDNPYDGGTQKERREHQQSRSLNTKRKNRLKAVKNVFNGYGLSYEDKKLYDVWKLRAVDSFERRLENDELFAILRFLAKHRGYKSLKIEDLIAEIEAKEKIGNCESGEIKIPEDTQKFTETLAYLDAMVCKYPDKTAAQVIWELESDRNNPTFRNHGDYRYMIRREYVAKEIDKIVLAQHEFGLFGDAAQCEAFIETLQAIIIEQDPVTPNPDNINNCLIYKEKMCAPVFSFSFDLFQMYKLVNDLHIEGIKITPDQREELIDSLLKSIHTFTCKASYSVKDIKKMLGIDDVAIKLNNQSESRKVKGKETPTVLLKFHFAHLLKKLDAQIVKAIFENPLHVTILDELATHIHLNVNPEMLIKEVTDTFQKYHLDFEAEQIKKFVLQLHKSKTSGTASYSFKALGDLITQMIDGKNESDAKEILGVSKSEDYSHFVKGIKYLKPQNKEGQLQYELDKNRISNHVVKSLVSWALRVITDLHVKHGPFDVIKLESTRELSQPDEVKRQIKSANDKNEQAWQALKQKYAKHFEAKGLNVENSKEYLLKLKLWEQQNELGIYSHNVLGIDDVLSPRTEIEHIVPKTSGGSNAEYNKALDLKTENAKKGNKLPLDYLTGEKREIYLAFVNELKDAHQINFKKFKSLTAESLKETFKEASDDVSLHATSYTEKLLGEILKRYYPFTTMLKENQRIMHISGRATSYLRRILNIDNKSRDTNFHHAEDAILLGVMSKSYLQNISTNFEKNYELTELNAKENFKKIVPHIDGAVPNEIFSHLRQSYLHDIDTNPFYIGINNTLKTPAFWVSKKPIGTKAHNETIQSKKNLAYYVPIENLLGSVKPNHKMSADEFVKKYNKEVYDKVQVVHDNPSDHTAKAFAAKRDAVASILNKGAFVTTKEERAELDKALREEMAQPLLDVNGNVMRRVKRIGEDASIAVRGGLAYTAPSLVCLRCSFEGNTKLRLQRMDIRTYAKNKESEHNQMDIFNNDLVEIFVEKAKTLQLLCFGLLKKFTLSGNRLGLGHPKYPTNLEYQPKNFAVKGKRKEFSIGSSCGIKKYRIDATGTVLGFYYLGRVLDDEKELFSKVLAYKAF